ncbi:histidine phosphatase family protein [Nocardioides agariphilus]|uniref:Histidine phosphatase family protein n=1 Tax=Nocardioides agariphilus TaxID=433664 RepID=A0A930VIT7_9ACTN|nr:histidine phosphatase family protein [Nocardioides agariphilus]
MTRRLVLVRHGQTSWNALWKAQGHADISLDDTGRGQARAAAPYLAGMSPVGIWSSDLARARETAEIFAAAAGVPVVLDPRLREYDVGVRSGLTTAEFAERYPAEHAAWLVNDESLLVEGEESSAQVRERVLPALREILSGLEAEQTALVVMHGACLKVGLSAMLGWPREVAATVRGMENCAWAVLGENSANGDLRLVSYNETAAVGQHPSRAAGGDFASEDAVG